MATKGIHFKHYYKVVQGLVRNVSERETFEEEVQSFLNTGWELQNFYVIADPHNGSIDVAYQTLTLVEEDE